MCDVLGGSCDCGSHMSLGGSCVHWVWEEGHVLGGHCGGVASRLLCGCCGQLCRLCECTDRNKVLHQYMYVVMVMV